MKVILFYLLLTSTIGFSQQNIQEFSKTSVDIYLKPSANLTSAAAIEMAARANKSAHLLNKNVSIAVLDGSGTIILLIRGDGIGPHNTEAARKKAYTALSTKMPTLLFSRNAASNNDTQNLNTLPDLLLLGGGVPVWYNGNVVGSVGIAGGGSPENDDMIAKSAAIIEADIKTIK